MHRDYLGSIVAISNQAGVVVEKRHFDAWGSLKNLEQNGVVVNITGSNIYGVNLLLDRGYTGHEHLLKAGLIHMNGRLYDPAMHRFLQPDNYVQDPSNTQNYNRYGYVLNNPLKYTDPTGEEFISLTTALIIAVSVAATTYTLGVMYGPGSFSFSGLFTTMIMAYTSCILTFGVGEAVGTIGNFWVKTAVSAVSHGTLQGGLSAIQGGNFWSGFASGSLSSVAASFWMGNGSSATNNSMSGGGRCFEGLATTAGITNQSASTILFGSIAGGVGARLSGGNFWQGAVTGGIVAGLNHVMHDNNSLEIQENKTYEQDIHDMLERYKIGDNIDKLIFKPYIGSEAMPFISEITRVSETTFNIKGKSVFGVSLIKKNASITIKKNAFIENPENKGFGRSGTSITLNNLPQITFTYKVGGVHKFSHFLIKDNHIAYVFANKLIYKDFRSYK